MRFHKSVAPIVHESQQRAIFEEHRLRERPDVYTVLRTVSLIIIEQSDLCKGPPAPVVEAILLGCDSPRAEICLISESH